MQRSKRASCIPWIEPSAFCSTPRPSVRPLERRVLSRPAPLSPISAVQSFLRCCHGPWEASRRENGGATKRVRRTPPDVGIRGARERLEEEAAEESAAAGGTDEEAYEGRAAAWCRAAADEGITGPHDCVASIAEGSGPWEKARLC